MTSTNAFDNGRKFFLIFFSLLLLSFYGKAQVQCKLATDLLDASIVVPTDGSNHGALAFKVIGGTAPYTVTVYDMQMNVIQPAKVFYTDIITLTGLAANYYWIDIVDANKCEVALDHDLQTPPCTFTAKTTAYVVPAPGMNNGSITIDIVDATGPFTVTVYDMAMNLIIPELTFNSEPFTIQNLPNAYYWVGITGYSTNSGKLCYGFVDVDLQCYQNCGPVQICSYTQGYWGVPGGQNTHLQKLQSLNLTGSPLLVGGTYTVTVNDPAAVIAALPGGGPSKALTVSGTLGTGVYAGDLKNSLLAQTITLGLNLRLSTGALLSNVPLTGLVSQAVIIAVTAYGQPATVGGLYAFANYTLGGGTNLYGVTLSQISDAETAINEYFDECRMYQFKTTTPMTMVMARGAQPRQAQVEAASGDLTVVAGPNPFQSNIRFVIKSKVSGNAELGLYNLSGAKVAVPFRGHVSAGQTQTVDYTVPSTMRGGLMYMLKVGNKVTSGKLVSGSR